MLLRIVVGVVMSYSLIKVLDSHRVVRDVWGQHYFRLSYCLAV